MNISNISQAKKEVVITLEQLRNTIIENHKRADQPASGFTISSMMIIETANGAKLMGRRAFHTLETGRGPGRVPYNFAAIIEQWIIDKGIPFEKKPYIRQPSDIWKPRYTPEERGISSLAYAIAANIKKNGTKLYQEGGRKDIFTEPINEAIPELKKKLAVIFKTEIERIQRL